MSELTRIPHLLTSYLQLPPETALILITNVLNATSNWIVLRYLLGAGKRRPNDSLDEGQANPSPNIVFVSFLRDWDFWRDGARRLALDLNASTRNGRIKYIDGLSALFSGRSPPASGATQKNETGHIVLSDFSLSIIETQILETLKNATSSTGTKPLLILDGLDFLLAATETNSTALLGTLMTWREASHSTILTISADGPLLHTQQTPLEIEHAILMSNLINQACFVMSCRLLSTGAARDVSGVLQVSRGGSATEFDGEIEEKEVLYLVGGDGGVKVFERGAGG